MTTDFHYFSEDRLRLIFDTVLVQDNGTYWVVAENDAGSTMSAPTTVEVFGIAHSHTHTHTHTRKLHTSS